MNDDDHASADTADAQPLHLQEDHTSLSQNRNDRPGPDVPLSHNAPSLDQLVADARAAEKRIAEAEKRSTELELTKRRTAKTVLLENLDQAERIAIAVDVHGQSVAEFARAAGIKQRRAQRVYKLAGKAGEIRKQVQDGEAKHGDAYKCPSWKRFVPKPEPGHQPDTTPPPSSTPPPPQVFEDAPHDASINQAVEHHQNALRTLGRDLVQEVNKGKKADQKVLANLEQLQTQHREKIAELEQSSSAKPEPTAADTAPTEEKDEVAVLRAKWQESIERR